VVPLELCSGQGLASIALPRALLSIMYVACTVLVILIVFVYNILD
jgi:hypothetical protein